MSDVRERYQRVAADFTERIEAVPPDAWANQSPCADWKARDVVRHVVETIGYFLGRGGVEPPKGPTVEEDPLRAWTVARDAALAALQDPTAGTKEFDGPMGRTTLEQLLGTFGIGDVVVHTWDLARATGLSERLDPDEVHRLFELMEPNDEMLRQGTAFGPKVEVPDDADEQTKLLAFTGRQP